MSRIWILRLLVCLTVSAFGVADATAKGGGGNIDRVIRDFRLIDEDGDKLISPAEWKRRGNFEKLDKDGNGFLDRQEFRAVFRGSLIENKPSDTYPAPVASANPDIDPQAVQAKVSALSLKSGLICAMARPRGRGCDLYEAVRRGMAETGVGPRFPAGADCPGIDDYWALDYGYKRGKPSWHGGIDIPVDWGTSMLAVADGSVVAVFSGDHSKRGKEVIIRHSPEDTGLPYWTYTGYGHMDSLPGFVPGERVKRGQVIGPTGNSGISGNGQGETKNRRAAIHFSIIHSESPNYAIEEDSVVPVDGRWMDPVGFYRANAPYDTDGLKALDDEEKFVPIPVVFNDGSTEPAASKRIWPYACKRE